MAASGSARIVDLTEIHLRMAMVRAGVWLTHMVCAAGILYAVVTPGQPNRPLIAALLAVGFAFALVIGFLPTERIVRSRLAELFFLAWSLADIALIAIIVAADGGATSPFGAVFFIPLIFAALSYPLPSIVIVGAADVLSYVAAALLAGTNPDATYVGFMAVALAATAVMCAWQAQNHDRHRSLLKLMSRTDPLTSCLNRRGFEERLDAELAEAHRSGQPLSLLLLDLDGFKAVNDRMGHAAGDELLTWVADGTAQSVRPMDSVGRLGGDEFAVLSPATSKAEALKVAERVRETLSDRIPVTIGISCFPEDGAIGEDLYRAADIELYALKYGAEPAPAVDPLDWAATLAGAVNTRMGEESGQAHSVRLATGLARRLGWRQDDLVSISLAAMVHDVGKVPVPDCILQKPGPLEPQEYEEVKRQLVKGAEMVGRIEGLAPIAPWLRHARENFDGSGYPNGLRGEQIPIAARVLRVVDAFTAMTSDRPYRPAMTLEAALEQLRRNSGSQFDPRCVQAFEDYLVAELQPAAH